jgi:hypothetical protein
MTQRGLVVHRLLLWSAGLAWLVGLAGFTYALIFKPRASVLEATWSPGTFASVTWVFVGLWIALIVYCTSIVASFSRATRPGALLAALLSAAYVVPAAILVSLASRLHAWWLAP